MSDAQAAGFQVLVKPAGPTCNLGCRYCYYLSKTELYPGTTSFRMSDEVLESFVRQYIASQSAPEIPFAWQGGEPLLLGVEFFRRAVELQKKHCPPTQRISNALQTNGTLLTAEWCEFLRDNRFLVGISIDGPRRLHDPYRVDKGGQPTFDRTLRGLELLRQYGVEFNTLTVLHRQNARRPLEVYRFLRQIGSRFMQFIPLVERVGAEKKTLAGPPEPDGKGGDAPVTPWSVEPAAFGEFLCAVFDEWLRHDVGEVYVQIFEVQLALHMGLPASLCVFAETCGKGLVLEHNGDLYACDHYVYPEYLLGNVRTRPLAELANLPRQAAFGAAKRDTLPKQCLACDVLWACRGECPKHRFGAARAGERGVNYFCAGYKRFFHHVAPYMEKMAALLRAERPAAGIMAALARQERQSRRQTR
ncbi:MAG: anaerobic sulfatase maturase [Planctomycetota bacterium]|nr:anaerobic sulfatase maturase [Planctomycetota bacterium]